MATVSPFVRTARRVALRNADALLAIAAAVIERETGGVYYSSSPHSRCDSAAIPRTLRGTVVRGVVYYEEADSKKWWDLQLKQP